MAETAAVADLRRQLAIAIQRAGAEERFAGQLLGQVSPQYLLLSGGEEAALTPGTAIVVRTLQSGRALGFETTVREVIEHPVRLYFVDLPAHVEVISLRKADRIDVFIPADVKYATGKGDDADTLLLHGNMLDVSGGGCRVYTKRSIPAASVVSVAFTLPGERHPCNISGSVIDAYTQNNVYGQRIKFFAAERNLDALTEIKRWVQQNAAFADVT